MTIAHRLARAGLTGLLAMGLVVDAGAQPASPPATAPALSLVVLGSGGPGATGRSGSSYLVLVDGTPRILVDAGPGSFARLGEAKLSLAKVDVVLLTHLHIDHAGELPGLFKARAVSSKGPIRFQVFGPDGRKGLWRRCELSVDDSFRRFAVRAGWCVRLFARILGADDDPAHRHSRHAAA